MTDDTTTAPHRTLPRHTLDEPWGRDPLRWPEYPESAANPAYGTNVSAWTVLHDDPWAIAVPSWGLLRTRVGNPFVALGATPSQSRWLERAIVALEVKIVEVSRSACDGVWIVRVDHRYQKHAGDTDRARRTWPDSSLDVCAAVLMSVARRLAGLPDDLPTQPPTDEQGFQAALKLSATRWRDAFEAAAAALRASDEAKAAAARFKQAIGVARALGLGAEAAGREASERAQDAYEAVAALRGVVHAHASWRGLLPPDTGWAAESEQALANAKTAARHAEQSARDCDAAAVEALIAYEQARRLPEGDA